VVKGGDLSAHPRTGRTRLRARRDRPATFRVRPYRLSEERRPQQETFADLLARASHLLAESLSTELKAHRLSAIEGRVLTALGARDGVPLVDLAQRLLVKQPTLTKVIDRLERGQLVHRRMPPEDRRFSLIDLTLRGRQLALRLLASTRDRDSQVAQILGRARLQKCRGMLAAMVDRLKQPSWHRSG